MAEQATVPEVQPEASSSSSIAGTKRSASPPAATAPASAAPAKKDTSKRQRIDKRGNNERSASPEGGSGEKRLPKRKVAILFGYCGIGYSGLQINPAVKTIEGDIFDVLCKAGCVSKDNAVNPTKVGLQRSARTDRGVHAAGNLLNLKLILNPPTVPSGTVEDLIAYLNEQLPPIIRIWDIKKVQSAFNARQSCDSRYYQYLLPTYVLLPPKPGSAMWRMFKSWVGDEEKEGSEEGKAMLQRLLYHPFWTEALRAVEAKDEGQAPATTDAAETTADLSPFRQDTLRKRKWRMADDEYGRSLLPRLRSLFNEFLNTKNFHNYTVAKPFMDASAKRTMKELNISDPFVVNDTEYVSITLHGQSFMLHQIRKMVGLLVLAVRSPAPVELIRETFNPTKIHVPKAPALGLLLNSPVFGGYNSKVKQHNARLASQVSNKKLTQEQYDEQSREEISFDSPIKEKMEAFRDEYIYQTQYKMEEEEEEFAKWENYIDAIVGGDFEYLNGKGKIPKGSVLGGVPKEKKNGERASTNGTAATVVGEADVKEKTSDGKGIKSEEYHDSDDEDDIAGKKAEDLEG